VNISIKECEELSDKFRLMAWDLRCEQGDHITFAQNPYVSPKWYCGHCGTELPPPSVKMVLAGATQ
jgi:hypothetical protein